MKKQNVKVIEFINEDESEYEIISRVLSEVGKCCVELNDESANKLIVFRGQANSKWSLLPSVFREGVKRNNDTTEFEYNLIHFLRANKFADTGNDELSVAVDAQHFGYPTRLLDVSYNMLSALFFACYSKEDSETMKEDGTLFVIKSKLLCPATSPNLHKIYKDVIENESFYNLFNYKDNHIFIERIKSNNRIIAQDGGFIMFLNNSTLNKNDYMEIQIDYRCKEKIVEGLKVYFNIDFGNMFPDIEHNKVNYLEKSAKYEYDKDIVWDVRYDIIKAYISEKMAYCEKTNNPEAQYRRLLRRLKTLQVDFIGIRSEKKYIELIAEYRFRIDRILHSLELESENVKDEGMNAIGRCKCILQELEGCWYV